ncbi:hypothetical protein DPMN_138175 [Dreissena polymorpha]|uniref:Uncharacterized protein n=1 Tax=Dreissena polymorpha TaxID=45954 RepID=A0A9D4JFD3_DREPO|nr:hypothetical protein DPMN_138175 [Dreissena polymorpha]
MRLDRTCIFLFMNIVLVTSAREPSCQACSRYDFEERLLERVLRNELVIETMLKETRETNVKVESAIKLLHEDRGKLADSLNGLEKSNTEMDTEMKGKLQGALKNMSDSLAFVEHLQEEMGTKLDNTIKTVMTNISDALAEMTQNASITGLQLKKENEILKGKC